MKDERHINASGFNEKIVDLRAYHDRLNSFIEKSENERQEIVRHILESPLRLEPNYIGEVLDEYWEEQKC